MRRARRLLSVPAGKGMKRILLVITAFAAIGCLSAAPALASQPGAAHPAAVAAAHPGHEVAAPDSALTAGCAVDACGLYAADGQTFYWNDLPYTSFTTPVVGHVDQNGLCWPFLECGLDAQYRGKEVLEFVSEGNGHPCMETDSVHSGVSLATCVPHDAGDYWVAVGNGKGFGLCPPNALWLVNVGFTNHYKTSNAVMYIHQTDQGPAENVATNLSISESDQWCLISQHL